MSELHAAVARYGAHWDANGGARWKAGLCAGVILFVWVADTVAGRGRWIANFF